MSYDVDFTNNPAKKITVQDQVINNSTSLSFVGKNYTGYGKIIADNFLHLLENFANTTAPASPIEGQLWYDNTPGINSLKIFNGTVWNPAGAIKKATTPPTLTESVNGDLWVNPNTKQLFMFSGTNWDLIGPQFSSGLKTGPLVDVITDTMDVDHSVLSIYSQNERIAIISQAVFIPKNIISGFAQVNKGINLSTANQTTDITKFWGIAESAEGLIVDGSVVSSSNFLRSDKISSTSKSISIQSNDGISLGSKLSFKISSNDVTNAINLTASHGKNINFDFVNLSQVTVSGLFIKSDSSVGIRTTTPTEALDVNGNILTNGNLKITSILDSTSLTTGSIVTSGGIAVTKHANFGSTSDFNDTLNLYKEDGGSVLLPTYSDTQVGMPLYDIGSYELPFRDIYAENLYGNLNGTFEGNVTGELYGSATKIRDIRSFSLTGDVTCTAIPFDGTADVTFETTVSPGFISAKPAATRSLLTDEILTFRASSGLQRTTKRLFLESVPVVPVGSIMPYAGSNSPVGYLLCDGSELMIASYPELFNIIGYSYRNKTGLLGAGTFALPDLRGRFPLGRDNMDNDLTVPEKNSSDPIPAGGNRNGVGNVGTDRANRVHHVSATTIGAGSGSEAFGSPSVIGVTGSNVTTNAEGNPNLIMNPYQTINYIIFTGVLQ